MPKAKGQRRFGQAVTVRIPGKKPFVAHKRKGDPANLERLKRTNPKVFYRSQAVSQVAAEYRSRGQRFSVTDPVVQQRVTERARQMMGS